jgi:hypothetical protein
MKLAAICVAPTELGGLGDGFTINMSRLAALPRFSAQLFKSSGRFSYAQQSCLLEQLTFGKK